MKVLKNNKIIIMLIIFLIIASFTISSFAYTITEFDPKGTTVKGGQSVVDDGSIIVGSIRVIGIIASVAILIVLGIKYMLGSIEEKAQYKKTMIPYLIGAIIVFATSTLATIVYKWAVSL